MDDREILFHSAVKQIVIKLRNGASERYQAIEGLRFFKSSDGDLFVAFKEDDGCATIALYARGEWTTILGHGIL